MELVTRSGAVLHLDPDDARAQELIRTRGEFNAHSLELWRLLVTSQPWDLVVDVGANYGEMLLAVPTDTPAEVVAFEPSARLLPYLRRTVDGAGLPVRVVPSAVSDRVGTEEFVVDVTWSGMSRLNDGRESGSDHVLVTETVDVTTLDAALRDSSARSACIKIDVEGAEAAVLAGAQETLDRLDRVAVMIEVLHMDLAHITELAQRWRLYLFDTRAGRLVRAPGYDPGHIDFLLKSGWCYFQDAVLVRSRGDEQWRPW